MIIVKIHGGLGNQLFQYSLGRYLAAKHRTILKLDISNYEKDHLRSYGLGNFNINAKVATAGEINKFTNNWEKIKNKFKPPYKRSIIVSLDHEFDKKVLELKDEVYLYGHWPSEKYFKDIENIIRAEITLKKELSDEARQIEKNILSTSSISLHVRRGDYLNQKMSKIFKICGLDYYKGAIDKILETENHPTFFIFSDDIEWTKSNLKIKFPIVFVSGQDIKNHEELFLMSLCKHNIIANSSFSWWGAWLNRNHGKIIVAPKAWFVNNDKFNTNDLIPKTWITI